MQQKQQIERSLSTCAINKSWRLSFCYPGPPSPEAQKISESTEARFIGGSETTSCRARQGPLARRDLEPMF